MREGNFSYQIKELVTPFVVHRGVSQGGRMLEPDQRVIFWQKRNRQVAGVNFSNEMVIISLAGLRALRAQNLVIVSNPAKPRVWTIRRIMESAEKVQVATSADQGASQPQQRRGGLVL